MPFELFFRQIIRCLAER